tara:strand:- start:184 stop:360 length:177 start_codon:yes stop_codon:yes gene_type:complete
MGENKKNKNELGVYIKNLKIICDKFKIMEVDNYDNNYNNNDTGIVFHKKLYEVYKKYE